MDSKIKECTDMCNEDEVKRICEKYGIETVEKEGYPIYMGKEMDENFSFSEMMRQPVDFGKC